MNKPIRKRAFDLYPGAGNLRWASAYTPDAEAWLREQLAAFAQIHAPMLDEMPGRIRFTLLGYDLADVEAYLRALWVERAEDWPEDVAMEAEGER